ncbi:type II toxin-antitoxin system death-on-curing family toxin [Kribbella sp. NPDC004536]|uniref:type II toxin-antitoxin system death-on-curing family toxin n=1 Tax=Kribbella sp. NPDC004536 TaxID=3364106 RepID=UPI00369CCC37
MREVVYLTTDQVVRINARFGGVVRERGTVDAATMRCAHSYGGAEFYSTVWEKAAALLWALATTQGFIDGNKRTAWTAMETFLALNGEFLRTSVVDAHVFVLAIANRAIEHEQVVEWLIQHRRS